MKKLFFALMVLVGMFSSCTNDDITISRAVTFKVNPATVVDNLYERNAGDLTSLSGNSKLQVTVYVYDSKGILVNKASESYSAYTHMMTADISLPKGTYTAVATTNVTSSIDYWTFSGTDQLSSFKITDNGYIGGKNKILGITVQSFSVGDGTQTVNIDVKNAGAVALVLFYKWNKYSDVSGYSLMGKQACDYVSFDNRGTMDYSLRSDNSYSFFKVKFDYDAQYTNASAYFFTFPIKNASFRFYALTTENKSLAISQEFIDNVELGKTYWFVYDFEEDEASWYDMTPSSARQTSNVSNMELLNLKNDADSHVVYDYEGKSISIR